MATALRGRAHRSNLFQPWRRHRPLQPRVLIPALTALLLIGGGLGALTPNNPAPYRDGRLATGWVVTSSGRYCRNGSVEVVKYVVSGTRYLVVDPFHCYPNGWRVLVSYLPGDPDAGRVLSQPSRRGAAVLFTLAGGVIALGVWLELRDESVRRQRRRLLHHYATAGLPFG